MEPYRVTYTPAATSANGLAAAVAYAGGGYALSATTMADGLAHIVGITGIAATNHSGKTFTVTGTGPDGESISEGIAGPNGAVLVSTTKYFKTVTSITVSSTTGADTFNLGWTAVAVSPLYVMNWRQQNFQTSLAMVVTGTINVTTQQCYDGLHGEYVTAYASLTWFPHASLTGKTANTDANTLSPITAVRLLVNSVTAGGTVALLVVQGD